MLRWKKSAPIGIIFVLHCYPPNTPYDNAKFKQQCMVGAPGANPMRLNMRDVRDRGLALEGRLVRVGGYLSLRNGFGLVPSLTSRGRDFYSFDHFTDFNTEIGVRVDPSLNLERFSECVGDLEHSWAAVEGKLRWHRTGVEILVTHVDTNAFPEDDTDHGSQKGATDIDRYEVTVEDYAQCVRAGGCQALDASDELLHYQGLGTPTVSDMSRCDAFIEGREKHPMNCVTWADAARYCHWAGKRLPSEGEWWAAWGRFNGSFVAAEEPDDSRSWFVKEMDSVEPPSTHPVGTDKDDVTMKGVFDMNGNVEEWTDSPACARADACGSFDRVILGGRTIDGDPIRRHGRFGGTFKPNLSTKGLRIGFPCAR